MTGAGKTHTMLGDIYHTTTGESGICSMAIQEMFKLLKEADKDAVTKISYLEIYNEQVVDLLDSSGNSLIIVEDPVKGIVVPGLTEYEVSSPKDLLKWMLKGNEKRTMAETSVNQFSSRSHAILQITVQSKCRNNVGKDKVTTSKLCLVDLAGSERAATTEKKGLRMLEGGKINKSLLALGNCINILSDKGKSGTCFVPYRDSKLTRLLKDSLGGNTRTAMIACIIPSSSSYDETINTLKYAERARRIKKQINANVKELDMDVAQYKEIIEGLKKEIAALKENEAKSSDLFEVVEETGWRGKKDLKSIEEDMEKTNYVKRKIEGEEEVMKSMRMSYNSVVEDDEYLHKLSHELLSKYEEHYEMKQSLQELVKLNAKNTSLLITHQASLDSLVRQKISESLSKSEYDKLQYLISQKAKEIESLKANIEENEKIKEQIEASLKQNSELQQKYISLVVKLQSHKKKEVLDLQIAVRTLKLEKIDLLMRNLQAQKEARLAEMQSVGKDQQILEMNAELERFKSLIHEKDEKLKQSEVEIKKQKAELMLLKSSVSRRSSVNEGSRRNLAISPSKLQDDKDDNKQLFELVQNNELDNSLLSLSSVSVRYEEVSKTDIELVDTCNNVPTNLHKKKRFSVPSAQSNKAPRKSDTHRLLITKKSVPGSQKILTVKGGQKTGKRRNGSTQNVKLEIINMYNITNIEKVDKLSINNEANGFVQISKNNNKQLTCYFKFLQLVHQHFHAFTSLFGEFLIVFFI
eukprot:TRINITY_DN3099_c0_g1_i1.p1 TRINITY_DN3099_c0_g1~~TRINITY_DN3099_c0_g1_i1.p1  ORF type:complete len:751 (-),score=98.93 TRINITY_DN3099_c0_g1_i1:1161-3413(-)